MTIGSRSEILILVLLLPITLPICICVWSAGVITGIAIKIFKWVYSGYDFYEGVKDED